MRQAEPSDAMVSPLHEDSLRSAERRIARVAEQVSFDPLPPGISPSVYSLLPRPLSPLEGQDGAELRSLPKLPFP